MSDAKISITVLFAISNVRFTVVLPHDYRVCDLKRDACHFSKIKRKNVQLSHKGRLLATRNSHGLLNTLWSVGIHPGQTILASSKLDGISDMLTEYEDPDW